METMTINKNQFEQLINEKVKKQVEMKLTKKYLIELFEDIALGNAIKKGDKGDFINSEKFKAKLKDKINKKMKIKIDQTFEKDTDKINNKKILQKVYEMINLLENAASIHEISSIKKMEGYKNYYRIRIGDYRIGLKIDKILFI